MTLASLFAHVCVLVVLCRNSYSKIFNIFTSALSTFIVNSLISFYINHTTTLICVTDGGHYSVVVSFSCFPVYAEKPPALSLDGDRTGMAASEEQLRLAAEVSVRKSSGPCGRQWFRR